MGLKIISGLARGIMLDTPPDRSMRPTSGRSREALFSSLGDISGKTFHDVFAGSGAMALEAASRGAGAVVLLEGNERHSKFIEKNIAKLRKAGVECPIELVRKKFSVGALTIMGKADIWFFDPPYAESGKFLTELLNNTVVTDLFSGSLIIWEMPDTTEDRVVFQQISNLHEVLDCRIRNLGGTDFLVGKVRDLKIV